MTIKSPSDAVVLTPETLPVHERGGGARTTPLVPPSLGTHSFITGYTSFDGGTEIPFHSPNCEESVVPAGCWPVAVRSMGRAATSSPRWWRTRRRAGPCSTRRPSAPRPPSPWPPWRGTTRTPSNWPTTPFGLSVSIWTGSTERGVQVTKRIATGAAFINAVTASDARVPFGGTKKPGYGRELAAARVRAFCNVRTYWAAGRA